jgi:hypothetical protein
MAKGMSAWMQLVVAVHERIKVQRDVDEAARRQLETRADDLDPENTCQADARASEQEDGGVKKNDRKNSKGGSKLGGILRKQVSTLVNKKVKR